MHIFVCTCVFCWCCTDVSGREVQIWNFFMPVALRRPCCWFAGCRNPAFVTLCPDSSPRLWAFSCFLLRCSSTRFSRHGNGKWACFITAAGLYQAPALFSDFIAATGQAARGKEQAVCAPNSQHLQMFAEGPEPRVTLTHAHYFSPNKL